MSSPNDIALEILLNLGLTKEKALILENEKLESQNSIYMRGDEGLGYQKSNVNPILEADQIFARLSSNNSVDNLYKTSIGSVQVSTDNSSTYSRLPKRLVKRSVKDYSDKDLAIILNQTDKDEAINVEVEPKNDEGTMKKRKRHRKSVDS